MKIIKIAQEDWGDSFIKERINSAEELIETSSGSRLSTYKVDYAEAYWKKYHDRLKADFFVYYKGFSTIPYALAVVKDGKPLEYVRHNGDMVEMGFEEMDSKSNEL
jgi:hypothetical protein